LADETEKDPQDWSPDGRFLLYSSVGATTGVDLWVLPLFGDRKPFPFLRTASNEGFAKFSPDGRWIAYTSYDAEQRANQPAEVYVAPFPGPGGKWQVSTSGGTQSRWRHDGKEIFYLGRSKLMAAAVRAESDRFEVGTVKALFTVRGSSQIGWHYDVSPDGERFLVSAPNESREDAPTLVVNWTGLLKK
jgi:Tol biopolymer transport system component